MILPGTALVLGQQQSSEAELKKLNVKIISNTKVTAYKPVADNKTELTLSTGSTMLVDLYLPSVGLSNNTGFMPSSMLDAGGYVKVDEFLRAGPTTGIWAAGDLTAVQRSGVLIAKAQALHVAKNLDLVIKGKAPLSYVVPGKDMFVVTLGRNKGVANVMGWKLPSFMVKMMKCKDFFLSTAAGIVNGA